MGLFCTIRTIPVFWIRVKVVANSLLCVQLRGIPRVHILATFATGRVIARRFSNPLKPLVSLSRLAGKYMHVEEGRLLVKSTELWTRARPELIRGAFALVGAKSVYTTTSMKFFPNIAVLRNLLCQYIHISCVTIGAKLYWILSRIRKSP